MAQIEPARALFDMPFPSRLIVAAAQAGALGNQIMRRAKPFAENTEHACFGIVSARAMGKRSLNGAQAV